MIYFRYTLCIVHVHDTARLELGPVVTCPTTSCEHSGHAARTRPGPKKQGSGKEKSGGLMQKMSGWWFGT